MEVDALLQAQAVMVHADALQAALRSINERKQKTLTKNFFVIHPLEGLSATETEFDVLEACLVHASGLPIFFAG